MTLSCIIVDDEPGALQILENYIGKLSSLSLTGKFHNAIEAYYYLKQNKVDVLFLDINMPEIDGFGLLNMLTHKPVVIFTTAYSEYALKGFEYSAIDYLHKPIRFERFVTAVEKAQKWCVVQQTTEFAEYIELKVDGQHKRINTTDIVYIEGLRNYIKLHTTNEMMIVLITMNEIENKLPGNVFVRIHKSYIINVSKIKITSNDQVEVNDTLLQVGKTYKKYFNEFMKFLEQRKS
jgi:DNA-binding LytR/AlgR family response regulator